MDILLDTDTGDISVVNSDLVLTEGQEAIEQNLRQRLQTFFKEWFLDNRIGIPYFEQVLVKNPDPIVVDSIFKKEIIETPGIEELIEFNASLDKSLRELNLSFKARTIDGGVINFSEVIS
jgi:hypothetical protein